MKIASDAKEQKNATYKQGEKKRQKNPEPTQMLELVDKDFKTYQELKAKTRCNGWTDGESQKQKQKL